MDKQRKFWVWALLFFVLESILAAVVSLLLNFPLLDTFAYSSFLLFAFSLFTFSQGDAWTNNVIADSKLNMMTHLNEEERADFFINLNPFLAGTFVFFIVGLIITGYLFIN
ncbi:MULTISPECIES: hypothetical protein [Cytobacillus]|jgi:hypothetical protein|uniref:Uncharacterized protein n=1 Tax=Cytobacillus firmus TaxID=1399 RepID=A0AA46PQW4_CYTFI|nr:MULTISPECIES: hypothetical protein [Cytobacillus]MCS0652876.1 hypothetical protein [Cytobacillus firmus]MCU1803925.1 hypothetical protein [Cytobacillus firmus]UYG95865.1 hypothetical protein OD459_02230 [Cytobacillus firmus]WHY36456.1 hypothetical protein QNH44_12055 [Cytobacillus firmus]